MSASSQRGQSLVGGDHRRRGVSSLGKLRNDEWRAKISIIMNDGAVIAYAAKLMGATPFYDKKRKRWHTYAEGFRAIQVAKLYWSSYAWSEEGASVRHCQCRIRLQGTRASVALQIGL